uniref:Uncharacterized protein n=1 Tax=Coptotermes formosanus TaxID=36987 RepID=R4UNA7_COPFO|nr:hypothetical protein [Coptotermes formosanus]
MGTTLLLHLVDMAPTRSLLLCAVLIGSALNLVHGLGLSPQGQQQDLGQDVSYSQGQGQSGGNFAGGRQGGFGQQRGFDVGAGGTRPGFAGRSYDGQPAGEDARNYNFRIYTEPEYYGYESKFPGGKAMFKSYRSDGSSFGRQGEYSGSGRSARPNENFGSFGGRSAKPNENFGSPGGQQLQY